MLSRATAIAREAWLEMEEEELDEGWILPSRNIEGGMRLEWISYAPIMTLGAAMWAYSKKGFACSFFTHCQSCIERQRTA